MDRVELAIRYVLSLPGVATANLGVHTIEQFRRNFEIARRFRPLATEEQERLASAGRGSVHQPFCRLTPPDPWNQEV